MSFVLDCSSTLTWIFADEAAEATDQLLDTLQNGAQAWVPALWHLELANVLIGAHRRGRIDQAGIEAFLSHLTSYAISVDVETIPRAWTKTPSARGSGGVCEPCEGVGPASGGGDGTARVGGGVGGRVRGEDVRARRHARPPAASGGDARRVRGEVIGSTIFRGSPRLLLRLSSLLHVLLA